MAKATKVLTGTTGNVKVDLTPRAAWMGFWNAVAGLACYALSTDATLTGLVFGTVNNGAFLSLVLFDGVIKPRL